MSAARSTATSVALFLLAVAVRALPWPTVLTEKSVYFFGHDAYYHMRRIVFALEHFPRALGFDPYLNHPVGAVAIWPPLFDWGLALLLLPLYAFGGVEAVERAAVWVPPILGGLTVVVLHRLALWLYGPRTALFAGLALALLSGHYWYSQIGFVDHHAAVSLGAALLLTQSLHFVSRNEDGDDPPAWSRTIALGATNALLILLWPGAVLYVALGIATIACHALTCSAGDARPRFERQAAMHALACLIVLPFGASLPAEPWGPYSPTVISHFQVWFFALFGLHAAVMAAWIDSPRSARRFPNRFGFALAAGAVLVAIGFALLPELRSAGGEAWRWLAKREAFQASVSESKPLFAVGDGFGTQVAERRLSRWVFVFPIALAAMAWEARGHARASARFAFIAWAVVIGALTVVQKRFFDTSTLALALSFGWAFAQAGSTLPGLLARGAARTSVATRLARVPAALALAGAAVWMFMPVLESYSFAFRNQLEWLRGERFTVQRPVAQKRALVRAARWLRAHSPATAGFRHADARGEYGVLGDWDHGHVVLYEAQRPTVVGNFGDDVGGANLEFVRRYFRAGESEANAIAESLLARYVVSEPTPPDQRAFLTPGSVRALLQEPQPDGLAHHRLIYESPLTPREREAGVRPAIRFYERVAGATIRGRARPGSRVIARLPLRSVPGGAEQITAETSADDDGVWSLRVAQPSGPSGPAVAGAAAWVIEAGGERAEVAISEADVRSGSTVESPPLR